MQTSLFSHEMRLNRLSELGDSLQKLRKIDWEFFRPMLNNALHRERKSNAGRPPYDAVLLFKILIIQRLYNLSDDQTEFQITDRISFMRFLGLTLDDKVPDAKTIWLFRERLSNANAIKTLFDAFTAQLESAGLITHSGTIVDATFVEVPKQRNTREENKIIKENGIPEEWKNDPNKIAQKDTDARWAVKNKEQFFGYKDHAKVDCDSKLITGFTVTSANIHDNAELGNLLDETDKVIYADSAYTDKKIPATAVSMINEKGCRYKKLTDEQKENNRIKSKTRARIEHVFGFMTNSMKGLTMRCIGIKRASFNIGLTNLIYNFFRSSFLMQEC